MTHNRPTSPAESPRDSLAPSAAAPAPDGHPADAQADAERRERYANAIGNHMARECTICGSDWDAADAAIAIADQEQQGLKSRAESAEAAHSAVWAKYQARGERIFELQGENARLHELAAAPSADRPTVLRWAADWFEEHCPEASGGLELCMCHAADELRRMAAEAGA